MLRKISDLYDAIPNLVKVCVISAVTYYLGSIGALEDISHMLAKLPVSQLILTQLRAYQIGSLPNGTYNILVADLEGDDAQESQTQNIVYSLRRALIIDEKPAYVTIRRTGRVLSISDGSNDAPELAQNWLNSVNGDLLIFGAVRKKDKSLKLRIVTNDARANKGAKDYALNEETFYLNNDFNADVASALVVRAASAVRVEENSIDYLVSVLRPQVDRLENLVSFKELSISPEQRMDLVEVYGLALLKLVDLSRGHDFLARAIENLRVASDFWKSRDLNRWAKTQHRLGVALFRRAEREGDEVALNGALAAFEDCLKVRTPDANRREWGESLNAKGSALFLKASLTLQPATLQDAISAFQRSLEAFPEDRFLSARAIVYDNLGSGLATLAIWEQDPARMIEAIETFGRAEASESSYVDPVGWAHTQINLGSALLELSRLRKSKSDVKLAIKTLNDASRVVSAQNDALWGRLNMALGHSYLLLRFFDGSLVDAELAAKAFKEAASVRPRDQQPRLWALTQTALAEAYLNLVSPDRPQPDLLDKAEKALMSVEEVAEARKDPGIWARNRVRLAITRRLQAKRARSCDLAAASRDLAAEIGANIMLGKDMQRYAIDQANEAEYLLGEWKCN